MKSDLLQDISVVPFLLYLFRTTCGPVSSLQSRRATM
jgi:hypothetical protein